MLGVGLQVIMWPLQASTLTLGVARALDLSYFARSCIPYPCR